MQMNPGKKTQNMVIYVSSNFILWWENWHNSWRQIYVIAFFYYLDGPGAEGGGGSRYMDKVSRGEDVKYGDTAQEALWVRQWEDLEKKIR